MLRSIFFLIGNILVVLGLSRILPDFVVSSYASAFWFVLVLSLLNIILVPFLRLLAFPINFVSFGLFSLIINIFVLIVTINFVNGVAITSGGFGPRAVTVLFVSVGLAIGQSVLNSVFKTQ